MKKILLSFSGLLILVLVACSSSTSSPAPSEVKPSAQAANGNVDIKMKGFAFDPKELTIKVGTKVTWTNLDNVGHDVKANDGSWGSDTLNNGQTFNKVFDKAGTYPYVCSFHPDMVGSIIVTP